MKVLYSIQATGNGHISRAREIIPILQQYCDLDLFVSGSNADVVLPYEVRHKSKGLSFYYNKTGGISYWETLKKMDVARIFREVRTFPVEKYDLIINDFEFISSWAALLKKVPCVAFGHQASFLSKKTPRPKGYNFHGELILKHYAPSKSAIGFHFERYDDFIYTPVIRKQIRDLEAVNEGHYTVYLPSYDDAFIFPLLNKFKDIRWEVFSKTAKMKTVQENVAFFPAQNETFIKSLSACEGILTNAGFESPAEAMYLKKKVFVIPIAGQHEQACNAEAMKKLGVPMVNKIDAAFQGLLSEWLNSKKVIEVDYPNHTAFLIEKIIGSYPQLKETTVNFFQPEAKAS
jgi:uncharacterized protein (TIGR00661 family)